MSLIFRFLFLCSFLLTLSCTSNNNFDEAEIVKLYHEIKNNNGLDSDLSEQILLNFFKEVSISDLKNRNSFEKELFFEECKCYCKDKLSISFNKSTELFELNVYEEFFENDLDWCPETSFMFSFKLEHNNISNIKLEFIAG